MQGCSGGLVAGVKCAACLPARRVAQPDHRGASELRPRQYPPQGSPFALVKEIRAIFAGTIILSGAMSTGADVLAAQALGADLAYLGTRFIATTEANADDAYKQMLIDAKAADIVYTSLFSGIAGNYLRASIARTGLDPDKLPEGGKNKMNFASAGSMELKAWKDIWSAGQSVSGIREVYTVATLIERMIGEYQAALSKLSITRCV